MASTTSNGGTARLSARAVAGVVTGIFGTMPLMAEPAGGRRRRPPPLKRMGRSAGGREKGGRNSDCRSVREILADSDENP